jgi:hypothetical protein
MFSPDPLFFLEASGDAADLKSLPILTRLGASVIPAILRVETPDRYISRIASSTLPALRHLQALYPARRGYEIAGIATVALAAAGGCELPVTSLEVFGHRDRGLVPWAYGRQWTA